MQTHLLLKVQFFCVCLDPACHWRYWKCQKTHEPKAAAETLQVGHLWMLLIKSRTACGLRIVRALSDEHPEARRKGALMNPHKDLSTPSWTGRGRRLNAALECSCFRIRIWDSKVRRLPKQPAGRLPATNLGAHALPQPPSPT